MKPKTKKVVNHVSDDSEGSELEIQITTEVSNEESQDSEPEKRLKNLLRKTHQNLKEL